MPLAHIPAKALIFISVVFVALVIVQLRWSTDVEDQAPAGPQEPQVSRVQISQEGRLVDVSPELAPPLAKMDDLIETNISLLSGGSTNERRATATELSYVTNEPSEQEKLLGLSQALKSKLRRALVDALHDPDAIVASSSAEALVGWWRMSASPAIAQSLREGLAAHEARQFDAALQAFQSAEALGRPLPPDLYRMKAEVYLAKGLLEQAVAECRRALQAEPKHFAALYVAAKAYAQMGEDRKALEALDEALSIYEAFPAAQHLRAELYRAA